MAQQLNTDQIKALNRAGGLSDKVSKMIYDKNPHARVLIDCAMHCYHNNHDWWKIPFGAFNDCMEIHGLHSYEGEWKDDKYHGFGKLTDQMGSVYIGEFCDNKKQGFGKQYCQTTFNTATYEIPPKTVCREPGRLEYEGEWHNNKKNGCGTSFGRKGEKGGVFEWHNNHVASGLFTRSAERCCGTWSACDRNPYCEERGWVWGFKSLADARFYAETRYRPAYNLEMRRLRLGHGPGWIHKSLPGLNGAPAFATAMARRACGAGEGNLCAWLHCALGIMRLSRSDDSAEAEEEVDTGLIECTRLERGDAVAEPSAPSLCEETPYDVIPEFFQNINPVEPSAPPMEKIDSFECIICLEHMGENLATTMCGHVFHNKCIQQCLSKSKRCPICNNGVNSVIKLFINVES